MRRTLLLDHLQGVNMSFRFISLFVALFSVFAFSSTVSIKKVVDLEILETYDTHLLHAGKLWEGRSKTGKVETPRVDMYSLGGAFEKSFELPYTPVHLFPNGADSVVVTGKNSAGGWKTFYTLIQREGANFTAKTTQFDEEYMVDHFVGDGKRMFFALFGDRNILAGTHGGTFRPLLPEKEEVIGPHNMVLRGDSLFVLNIHNIIGEETNLSRIDLKTNKVEVLFPGVRNGFRELLYHEKSNLIAVSERSENQVLLVSPDTGKLERTISTPYPKALASLGKCLAVANPETRVVSFFDLSSKDSKEIDSWDLSKAGTTFRKANAISIDTTSGRLYARSTYLCTGCAETMSSVIIAEDPAKKAFDYCLK